MRGRRVVVVVGVLHAGVEMLRRAVVHHPAGPRELRTLAVGRLRLSWRPARIGQVVELKIAV